ncbi:MAG: hypothetical protein ACR2MG_11535 [Pyrinomonadaceae bacterium]
MIKLPEVTVSEQVLDKLKEFQDEIDKLPTFAEKSEKAKSSFKSKNRRGNRTFDAVKKGLTKMCSGARRCIYCEDSVGDEVEHIRPKDFFPQMCFVWENYVYACGNCNSPKNNKFAIFRDDTDDFYEVSLNIGIEPPEGNDVMINPREENPMDYCILDLSETFKFVVIPTLNQKDKQRAEYTFFTLLNLNEPPREFLRQAREDAYDDYKARFEKYAGEKKGNKDENKLNKMIEGIKRKQHPTVWKEMQRYYRENWLKPIDEELHNLFDEFPEALDW